MYSSHLTQDLSANTIQGVVRNVLEHTLTMDVENISLPSRATAQRMVAEAGELAMIRASLRQKDKVTTDTLRNTHS